jgi:hypothetical protein
MTATLSLRRGSLIPMLDIGWKDILAAGDDHILLSIHDVKEPLPIETTEVSGAQRTARQERAPI